MTIIAAIALAAGAYLLQSASPVQQLPDQKDWSDPAKADPLLSGSYSGPLPSQRYAMLRAEKRDAVWADATERALIARYAILLRKYGVRQPVRALCGETTCEIAMKLDLSLRKTAKLTNELQGRELADSLAKIGLMGDSASFGGPDKSYVHSSYWLRKPRLNAAPSPIVQAPESR